MLMSKVIDKLQAGYDPTTLSGQIEDDFSGIVAKRAENPDLPYID